ncbi:hypothetical protein PTSG_05865 [Salpingoeca rosetta]|uniref:Uncharacterized protein n=1 Tax=Salpingoeca rosetta (strain ATCC 50818 / BSB-021) TaxID=946362 RepID=F2UD06_SALR5|nr:uncharacterized protein PTSG_05865 [Salpingoeca rosetta]EGD74501.1 hypothetical protein PTSG_05865 [Salpingoeca rosetta]|eukprot:XP_004992758.1 hypothetical protein PTSG_05865 [Salpingoeca rosetta]
MPTTRRSARLHQFKQRFERSSEVLQNSRQTRRQHQRSVTRQQRLNENRDMESTNTSLVDFSTMPKMDRRQKLQIWQKAREEKRQQEQEQATANAKPPFIVGRARSPFKTMEQFIKATAVNSELEGEINRALGQAELLMRKLMPKYLELCHNANNDDATVRLDDLQGYWDARVEAQVMDIKAMFKALDEIRSNNWQHKQETPEPAAPKKRKAKKKVVRKARKGKPSSAVAAFLAKKRAEKRTAATASPQIELAVAPKPASLPAPVPPPSLDDVANGVDALIADNITAASPIAADALPRRKNARLSLRDDSDVETDNDDNGNGIAMVAPITPLFSGKRRTAAGARRNNSMLLTPVRASKTERESLGAEVIFTPVRRSRRTTPSKYRNANTVMEFSTAIEQPNFAYKPNPALDVRADATAQQNATDGAAHHATEQQQQQQEEDIPCTPVNASSTRRRRSSLRALTPNSNLAALLTCETPQQTPQRGGDNADSCAPSPALINLTPRPCTSTPLFMSSRKRPSRARPALACITEDDENTSPNADANTGSSPSSRQNVAAPIFDLLA